MDGLFEVAVADDGSEDETLGLVEEFRREAAFPVAFTSHEHEGFQPARCRNEGVRITSAPYVLFVNCDCVLPPDHLRIHLSERRPALVVGSDSLRLPEEQSERVARGWRADEAARQAPLRERWRVTRDDLDAKLNWLFRNPGKPKLFADNIAVWRRDLSRVNGWDEKFRGWGGEDDDLRMRLLQAGLRIRSIRNLTRVLHLWHPPDPTVPRRWTEGRNAAFVQRGFRLTRCFDGLSKRRLEDLSIRVRNASRYRNTIVGALPFLREPAAPGERLEVECLFLPGTEGFTGDADCNVLVLADRVARPPFGRTDVLVTDLSDVRFAGPRFSLNDIHRIWEVIL